MIGYKFKIKWKNLKDCSTLKKIVTIYIEEGITVGDVWSMAGRAAGDMYMPNDMVLVSIKFLEILDDKRE